MAQEATLLEAMWEAGGDADLILERLESGHLQLAGTFKGDEAAMVRGAENPPSRAKEDR